MEPVHIHDHVEQALALLLEQFKDKPNLEALVDALVTQVQDLEDVFHALIYERLPDTAIGAQLEQIGELVGELRGGLSDEDFRRFIRARIQVNLSCGEPERLIGVLKTLTGADNVQLEQCHPTTAILFYEVASALTTSLRTRIKTQMYDAVGAGVQLHIVEHGPEYFGFLDDPDALGLDEGFLAEEI